MLAYTLNRMLEQHSIVVERDVAVADAFGAEAGTNFQPYMTISGLFSWWPSKGEGAFDEHANVQRSVNTSGGNVLLHKNTPVTEKDRIKEIVEPKGDVIVGPFRITSVRETPTHMELSVELP